MTIICEFCDTLAIVQNLAYFPSFIFHLLSKLIDDLTASFSYPFFNKLDDPVLDSVKKVFDVLNFIDDVPIEVRQQVLVL